MVWPKHCDNSGKRDLRGEGDQDLPVHKSSVSGFQLSSDPCATRGEIGDEAMNGDRKQPVAALPSGHSILSLNTAGNRPPFIEL